MMMVYGVKVGLFRKLIQVTMKNLLSFTKVIGQDNGKQATFKRFILLINWRKNVDWMERNLKKIIGWCILGLLCIGVFIGILCIGGWATIASITFLIGLALLVLFALHLING